jgi:nitrite reductase/ring-hydroxylating ferredoxin subunit
MKIKLMKKIFFSTLLGLILISCSKNSIANSNCNFLLNLGVNTSINLNLPQFSQLQFVSNSVYVPNVGNGGIIVTNSGTGFLAWDASDPNHTPAPCSVLSISGLEGNCGCTDANIYSLITGQPLNDSSLRCGLKAYRVEVSGSNLIITN